MGLSAFFKYYKRQELLFIHKIKWKIIYYVGRVWKVVFEAPYETADNLLFYQFYWMAVSFPCVTRTYITGTV